MILHSDAPSSRRTASGVARKRRPSRLPLWLAVACLAVSSLGVACRIAETSDPDKNQGDSGGTKNETAAGGGEGKPVRTTTRFAVTASTTTKTATSTAMIMTAAKTTQ